MTNIITYFAIIVFTFRFAAEAFNVRQIVYVFLLNIKNCMPEANNMTKNDMKYRLSIQYLYPYILPAPNKSKGV